MTFIMLIVIISTSIITIKIIIIIIILSQMLATLIGNHISISSSSSDLFASAENHTHKFTNINEPGVARLAKLLQLPQQCMQKT